MKKFVLLFFLLILIPSCINQPIHDARSKYLNPITHQHKRLNILNQDKYRHPLAKPQTKRKLIKPKTINLDKW